MLHGGAVQQGAGPSIGYVYVTYTCHLCAIYVTYASHATEMLAGGGAETCKIHTSNTSYVDVKRRRFPCAHLHSLVIVKREREHVNDRAPCRRHERVNDGARYTLSSCRHALLQA